MSLAKYSGDGLSSSMIKTDQLQLLHLVLRAGQQLHEHRLVGELRIQCRSSRARLDMPGTQLPLSALQLTVLQGGAVLALVAELDISLLLSLVLKR